MKYIRTKNGKIYKTLEDYMQSDLPPTKIRVEDVAKDWHIIISKSEIIKQADTIEELCDEFVLITDDEEINKRDCVRLKKHTFMRGQKGLSFSITERDKKENGYYGAIWTDKGLIYVAKMNDKGELELL